MAFTLDNSREFQRAYDGLNGSTRAQYIYDKNTNDALREMYSLGTYDHTLRDIRVSLAVPYSTGTVSITAGGTAVTGVGTTFTAAMQGRFIRFNGEANQYLITGFTNGTSITIEAYLGTANLSGVSYTITEDRKALPSLCRSIHEIVLTNASGARGQVYYLEPRTFEQINHMRINYANSTYPYFYATKWENPTSGNVPLGYVYLYPSPSVAQTVTIYYNTWPVLLSSASDQAPIPYELEGVLREYILGFLYREQKKPEWQVQLDKAKALAIAAIGACRSNTAHRYRKEWRPHFTCDEYREPVIDPNILPYLSP